MNVNRENVEKFLTSNGWTLNNTDDYFTTYTKDNSIGFDIDDDEIVVIGEVGDIAHFPINTLALYTLLGYLIQNHFIATDYIWVR